MPGLMSGDWKRSTVSGPQRLQHYAWTAPDLSATAPALDSTLSRSIRPRRTRTRDPVPTSSLAGVVGRGAVPSSMCIPRYERAIGIHRMGDRASEMFFSRRVSRYLDDYLKQRG